MYTGSSRLPVLIIMQYSLTLCSCNLEYIHACHNAASSKNPGTAGKINGISTRKLYETVQWYWSNWIGVDFILLDSTVSEIFCFKYDRCVLDFKATLKVLSGNTDVNYLICGIVTHRFLLPEVVQQRTDHVVRLKQNRRVFENVQR